MLQQAVERESNHHAFGPHSQAVGHPPSRNLYEVSPKNGETPSHFNSNGGRPINKIHSAPRPDQLVLENGLDHLQLKNDDPVEPPIRPSTTPSDLGIGGDIKNTDNVPEEHLLVSKTTKLLLCSFFIILYPVLWIIYGVYRKQLWEASIETSIYLSQYGGFLLGYSWTFSEIFYKWYVGVIGILIVFSPRKDSAYKSIFTFLISYSARQYIRLSIAEPRPQYRSTGITYRGGCECSYGMPSGHSEGSCMLYSLIFYELVIQNRKVSKRTKIFFIIFGVYIVLSIMFARVYYGRHSIPQVVLGATQGLFAFSVMTLFEPKLDMFFRRYLRGGKVEEVVITVGSLIFTAVSLFSWYLYFEGSIIKKDLQAVDCFKCLVDEKEPIRLDLGKSLTLPSVSVGLVIGNSVARIAYPVYNEAMLHENWSLKGIYRFILMAFCFSPMLIGYLLKVSPDAIVAISTGVYIISGFFISYFFIYVSNKLDIVIIGDIRSKKIHFTQPRNPDVDVVVNQPPVPPGQQTSANHSERQP